MMSSIALPPDTLRFTGLRTKVADPAERSGCGRERERGREGAVTERRFYSAEYPTGAGFWREGLANSALSAAKTGKWCVSFFTTGFKPRAIESVTPLWF
jgi:hypothetical protein